MRQPVLRHVFKLRDGSVLILPREDAKRIVDRRGGMTQTIWEVKDGPLWRRLWPEEIESWNVEMR